MAIHPRIDPRPAGLGDCHRAASPAAEAGEADDDWSDAAELVRRIASEGRLAVDAAWLEAE